MTIPVLAPDKHITPQTDSGPFRAALRWTWAHKIRTLVVLGGALLAVELLTIPFAGVWALASSNPGRTALMEQRIREADRKGTSLTIVQTWIPLSRVPRHVQDAVIVAEDGTFYEHGGIDWFEVQESIEKNLEEGRAARGASTITQQLAKNLFLSTSKDPVRKLKEVVITLLMEWRLDKRRIFEIYLNIIEWGPGVFGIEAAARTYFGKSASMLTVEEGVRLAAVIPSPLRHRPDVNTRYVLRRKGIVLSRMAARNKLPKSPTEETPSRSLEQSPEADSGGVTPADTGNSPADSTAPDQGT